MKVITSETAIRILQQNIENRIYISPDEDETIEKVMAINYAIQAIRERDELYSNIDKLIEKVKDWKVK